MQAYGATLFEGLPTKELVSVLDGLEPRQFPAGAIVLGEGDTARKIYVVQSGKADVFIADRHGREHCVGHVGPGATLGEMSLFTGQPASATVRATTELEVLVLSEAQFHHAAAVFPRLYFN